MLLIQINHTRCNPFPLRGSKNKRPHIVNLSVLYEYHEQVVPVREQNLFIFIDKYVCKRKTDTHSLSLRKGNGLYRRVIQFMDF